MSLLAAVALGVVSPKDAFAGFSDDIVIIVGSALLVSAGVARSGIMELAIHRYAPDVGSVRAQLALLVITVAVLSAFVKNIGALAIMIPIAFQFARRSNVSPSTFLMPMSFASLLGGLMTQIGTSPNIVVSRIREEMTGQPFTHVRLHPGRPGPDGRRPAFSRFCSTGCCRSANAQGVPLHEALNIKNYSLEAKVGAGFRHTRQDRVGPDQDRRGRSRHHIDTSRRLREAGALSRRRAAQRRHIAAAKAITKRWTG